MKSRWSAVAVVGLLSGFGATSDGQQVFRYSEHPAGGNTFVLGYPPPAPVDVAGPIAGFRTWDGLHARHQDLMLLHEHVAGEIVGATREQREIWVYVLGDDDALTRNAGPESSVLVSGGVHAREWGSPEVTTGLIEAAAAGVGDEYLYDYLTDNVHFAVVPVVNIDGLVQTQRYPERVLVGADPRVPDSWPRDGRMRRKNMRGADGLLQTFGDHLAGVDLNRNFDPFWAMTTASSGNPASLVYHGTASFSEPEAQALMAAAQVARTDRLRWYEDVHSFTQVLFSVDTFHPARNAAQARLLSTFSGFHDAWSRERHGRGRWYAQDPNPPGVGIGVAAEYFAYVHDIPSWTLEIEPRNGGEDYGGVGAEHDGFILPDAEVTRLREDMALTHAVVAYRQAGPPSVRQVEIVDGSGRVVQRRSWQYRSDRRREIERVDAEPLLPGRTYALRIAFDKPMRWDRDGSPAAAPGHELPLEPGIRLGDGDATWQRLDPGRGHWASESGSGYLDYRYDTFEVAFEAPLDPSLFEVGNLVVEIDAQDFTGQRLDADPATVADWSAGSWVGYENESGIAGDAGGVDRSFQLRIVDPRAARRWLLRRGR